MAIEFIFATPLHGAGGGDKICPLRSSMSLTSGSEGRRGNRRTQESAAFSSGERKKGVDEAKRILHNLVSLLLTQQRRKKPVVEQF
ncbi:hypothetical protein E1N52_39615 [Paraburkholderia guartelaensis]|uniref:Uncharacterized protein n=1 Tax=Paraburkholderia guartelaensis TaxID=2546446 RepID=A0A4R5L455_9BURK|nr:hypothetical protein [Paraburkholderia guartelaensis]TDG02497.1 hypothetical protein E1N52_39615 [Paraburkholderia guartelaensis]